MNTADDVRKLARDVERLVKACDYALRQFIDLRDHPEPELIIENRIDEIIDFLSGTLGDLESGDA
jgi:hypothetical protein